MVIHGLMLTDPRMAPREGWIRVEGGRIAEVGEGAPRGGGGGAAPAGRIICPGFVDAHIHLPQIESVGCIGMELLEWLDRVIFPAEVWWGRGGAASMLRTAVGRMLRQGTLGFAGYLTSHGDVNGEVLRTLASGVGLAARLRFVVGRVAMDRSAPEALIAEDKWRAAQSPMPSAALADVAKSAAARGEVSLNPRFAVSCSEELLGEIGWLCKERERGGRAAMVQTHLAESRGECARVAELFPSDANYTSVYDRFGLLTARTLLAHCIHLADEEWELIRKRGSVVVHCPTANTFLEAGLFNLDKAREHGVRLALGTDVAAGADVAMPRVARAMIETAQVRRMTAPGGTGRGVHVPSPAEAWEMITRGNAEAIGWKDGGRLEAGAAADVLALRVPETWLDEHLVGRLIYNWSDHLLESRIVEGRAVDAGSISG